MVHGSARHSPSQGQIESLNLHAIRFLLKWCADNDVVHWHMGVPHLRWNRMSNCHSGTKTAPYTYTFGITPRHGLSNLPIAPDLLRKLETETQLNGLLCIPDGARHDSNVTTNDLAIGRDVGAEVTELKRRRDEARALATGAMEMGRSAEKLWTVAEAQASLQSIIEGIENSASGGRKRRRLEEDRDDVVKAIPFLETAEKLDVDIAKLEAAPAVAPQQRAKIESALAAAINRLAELNRTARNAADLGADVELTTDVAAAEISRLREDLKSAKAGRQTDRLKEDIEGYKAALALLHTADEVNAEADTLRHSLERLPLVSASPSETTVAEPVTTATADTTTDVVNSQAPAEPQPVTTVTTDVTTDVTNSQAPAEPQPVTTVPTDVTTDVTNSQAPAEPHLSETGVAGAGAAFGALFAKGDRVVVAVVNAATRTGTVAEAGERHVSGVWAVRVQFDRGINSRSPCWIASSTVSLDLAAAPASALETTHATPSVMRKRASSSDAACSPNRKELRQTAHENSVHQAGKVAKRAFNKAGGWVPKVGDLVSISVHRVDSSKLSPTNIIGVIVEFTTSGQQFRVWTKSGLLKTNYTAGNVSRCKSTAAAMGLGSAVSDASAILRLPARERGNRSISERAAIKACSSASAKGLMQLSSLFCTCTSGKCTGCSCAKASRRCSSQCHKGQGNKNCTNHD